MKIKIVGAKTLKRYTENILRKGFSDNSWTIDETDQDCTLYQIHGAPKATDDDKRIIHDLEMDSSKSTGAKIAILLHRPDEIQDRHPEVSDIFKETNRKFGLVFFGKLHLNDAFYESKNAIKTIIPHGFFEFEPITQTDPIIIGTNTTWGEMRSTHHLLEIIDNLFDIKTTQNIIGYIGGKPTEELEIPKLQELSSSELIDIKDYTPRSDYSGKRIIFVDKNEEQPSGMGITFNTQLYFYGKKIRTGESSGSAHTSLCVPVVFEMNDAEKAEGLKIVKVPYKSQDDIESADLAAGATLVMDMIKDNSYIEALTHNLQQSKIFSAKNTANKYIELFKTL